MDIMSLLKEEYEHEMSLRHEEDETYDQTPDYGEFIEFARKYLGEVNQPVQVTYPVCGIGLRLQHGQIISFLSQEEQSGMLKDTSIPVTRPKSIPGMSSMIPSGAVEIFGGS